MQVEVNKPNVLLLQKLGELTEDPNKDVKIVKNGHTYSLEVPPVCNFLVSWFRWLTFQKPLKTSDDLKELRKFFEHIAVTVKDDPVLKALYKPLVEKAFQGLKELYKELSVEKSINSMIKRNDVLEAFGVALRQEAGLNELLGINVERLLAQEQVDATPFDLRREIPIVEFSKMQAALEALEKAHPGQTFTLEELQEHLGPLLQREHVPMGAALDFLYRHDFIHFEAVDKALTKLMGKRHGSNRVTAHSLAKFFKQLNLDITTTFQGKLYAYSEFYKHQFRDEKSNNDAFKRELRPDVQEMLLAKKQAMDKQIKELFGKGNVIISNSFNRLRVFVTQGIQERFNITGKVMSDDEDNVREARDEKAYNGDFSFSIKEMLGLGKGLEVQMQDRIVDAARLNEEEANHLLLQCLANHIDSEKMVMVVQRLCPHDYHRYVYSATGKTLNKKEWCEALLQDGKRDEKQLQALGKFFDQPGKGESLSINIAGTTGSVNTIALEKHSEILAKNQRKISFRQHEDGSLSVQVFIGATGVNQVGIEEGAMGMGDESNESYQKMSAAKVKVLQDKQEDGVAELGESTVVSLYFSRDVVLDPALKAFSDKIHYLRDRSSLYIKIRNLFCYYIGYKFGMEMVEIPRLRKTLELRIDLGEVIAYPKVYVVAKAIIDKGLGDEWLKKENFEESQHPFREALIEAQEIFNKKDKTAQDEAFIRSLQEALAHFRKKQKAHSASS